MRTTDRSIARDILDVQEGTGPVPILDAAGVLDVIRRARRVAVVGASPDPMRPSNSVMRQLLAAGLECVPVNPFATEVLGIVALPTLEAAVEAGDAIDIVDVFRRPEHTPDIARSAVATGAGTLWLQQGVVSWEAARIAVDGGLSVAMDRCLAVDLRRLRAMER